MKKLLLFLLLTWGASLHAQHDTLAQQRLQAFVKNAQAFSFLYPQEKVYLHFDNTGYYVGEDMWFQAYVVGAQTLRPTEMSKVLYVELLSAEGELLEAKKLKIENGRADGYFLLKGYYYAGFYEVRAYTRCMLNFDKAGVFSRVFPVFNKLKKEGEYSPKMTLRDVRQSSVGERESAPKLDNLNITFYPEGGNLVQGLSSRVAFKAANHRGQSVVVHGAVYNAKGEAVSTLTTQHNGMGIFDLTPDGQKYVVKATHGGKEYSFSLPAAVRQGYVLRVDNANPQQMRALLYKNSAAPTEVIGAMLLCRGKPYWFDTLRLSSEEPTLLAIDKDRLPAGVAQLTVFSSSGEVLAERLIFVRQDEETVSIKSSVSSSYAPLSPVSISFSVVDVHNKPVQTVFSLSVYDSQTSVGTGYAGNIMANLLLSSDLKGYVETPAYYFEKNDRSRRLALDLLLMVQGWRRYEWKTMSGLEPFSVSHYIEKGLLVDGAVLSDVRKKPMKNVNVSMWLSSPNGLSQSGTCATDENGRFNFLLKDFYGVANFNLMSKQRGRRVWSSITLDRDLSFTPRAYLPNETDLSHVAAQAGAVAKSDTVDGKYYIVNNDSVDRAYELAEIKITDKNRWTAPAPQYATISYDVRQEQDKLRDKGEREYGSFLDFLSAKGFLMCREEPLEESQVREGQSFGATYRTTCTYKGKPVRFVVNGTLDGAELGFQPSIDEAMEGWIEAVNQVYPVNELLADDVERVIIDEEGRTCAHCQTSATWKANMTIIYVYTNRSGQRRVENKGIRATTLQGYSAPAQFYAPNYKTYTLPIGKKDFRRTLYWNPNVATDSLGRAAVQLYNNSTATELGITAETLTTDGRLGISE